MFHNSTTLHRRSIHFSVTGRESRVVYNMGWVAVKKLEASVFWESIMPLRKLGRAYSWLFGWPLIKKGGEYAMKGLRKGVEAAQWTAYATREAVKGTLIAGTAVPVAAAYSRLVAIKRTLWDTGKAAFVAPFKMAYGVLKAPGEMIEGVREAVSGVWKNGKEAVSSLFSLKLGGVVSHTRQAIGSLFKPITRPVKRILAPAAIVAATAFGAQWQSVTSVRDAITQTIPEGIGIIRGAPQVASAKIEEKRLIREAKMATLEAEKKVQDEAWMAKIDEKRGRASKPPAAAGGAKGASFKNAA